MTSHMIAVQPSCQLTIEVLDRSGRKGSSSFGSPPSRGVDARHSVLGSLLASMLIRWVVIELIELFQGVISSRLRNRLTDGEIDREGNVRALCGQYVRCDVASEVCFVCYPATSIYKYA